MANELVAVVLSGRKRAAAGLLESYEAEGNALPTAGGFSVVLDGEGAPAALIRTREVTIRGNVPSGAAIPLGTYPSAATEPSLRMSFASTSRSKPA